MNSALNFVVYLMMMGIDKVNLFFRKKQNKALKKRSFSMNLRLSAISLGAAIIAACSSTPPAAVPSSGAETVYRWSSNIDPNAARAYSSFLIGRYAALTNDPKEAARRYAEAVAREPGDADLVERAVFTALLSGEMDAAIYIAESAGPEVISNVALPRLTLAVDALNKGCLLYTSPSPRDS